MDDKNHFRESLWKLRFTFCKYLQINHLAYCIQHTCMYDIWKRNMWCEYFMGSISYIEVVIIFIYSCTINNLYWNLWLNLPLIIKNEPLKTKLSRTTSKLLSARNPCIVKHSINNNIESFEVVPAGHRQNQKGELNRITLHKDSFCWSLFDFHKISSSLHNRNR